MDDVSELFLILEKQSKMVDTLIGSSSNDKLVKKNITPADNSTLTNDKTSATLTSKEQSRMEKIAAILFKPFQGQLKSPESTKTPTVNLSKPTITQEIAKPLATPVNLSKPTITQEIAKPLSLDKPKDEATLTSNSKSKYKTISSIFVEEYFGQLKKNTPDVAEKTLSEKVATPIQKDKSWGGMEKIKSTGSGILSTLAGLLGLESLMPGALLTALKDKLKKFGIKMVIGALTDLKNILKKVITNILKKALDGLKYIIKGAFDLAWKGAKGLVTGAMDLAKTGVQTVAKSKVGQSVATSTVGRAASSAGSFLSSAWKSTTGAVKAITGAVGRAGSAVGRVGSSVVKGVEELTVGSAKKELGEVAKGTLKRVGGMGGILKLFQKIPLIGAVIQSALSAWEISKFKDQLARGDISIDTIQEKAGTEVLKGVMSLVGAGAGQVVGGILGSVVPVVGTGIGGFLGGLAGGIVGPMIADVLAKYVIPPSATKSIGAFVTGTSAPKEEMQDFIIARGGQVHKFSTEDEVMGMKNGGAIARYLEHQNRQTYGVLKSTHPSPVLDLIKINTTANNYLKAIANNTSLMLKSLGNATGGSPIIMNSPPAPQPSQKQEPITLSDNRDAYYSSPYALA